MSSGNLVLSNAGVIFIKKCNLCGKDCPLTDENGEPINEHRDEVQSVGANYCQACWNVLDGKTKMGARKCQRKVKIKYSDYPLPGFRLTLDQKRYKREKN
jgi:hypothetical protein